MESRVVDLLTAWATVTVVGLAAIGLLATDLVLRELAGAARVSARPVRLGLLLTLAFLVLVVLRFASRAG
jgi:uncharacterized YccA/Bax inhibitor family protein